MLDMNVLAHSRTGLLITTDLLFLAAKMWDTRSFQQKQAALLQAQKTEEIYRSQRTHNLVTPHITESENMMVFLHGLKSYPGVWAPYLASLPKDDSISYIVPPIHNRGNCSVKDAAQPILEFLQPHISRHILLVGHSRGAVIAGYIERHLQAKRIDLISIAGPHGGNRHMTNSGDLCEALVEEGRYLSRFAIEQIQIWQKLPNRGWRSFFATADDQRIHPIHTCFPNVPNSEYILLENTSHTAIIETVRTAVLSKIARLVSENAGIAEFG